MSLQWQQHQSQFGKRWWGIGCIVHMAMVEPTAVEPTGIKCCDVGLKSKYMASDGIAICRHFPVSASALLPSSSPEWSWRSPPRLYVNACHRWKLGNGIVDIRQVWEKQRREEEFSTNFSYHMQCMHTERMAIYNLNSALCRVHRCTCT